MQERGSLTLRYNSVFFIIYNQKEQALPMVTKFIFFRSSYNPYFDILFLLIKPLPTNVHTYLPSLYKKAGVVKHLP